MPLDFGIGEGLAAILGGGAFLEAAAPIAVAATEGAALGAGGAALTGGNVGRGALFGGLGGGLAAGAGEAFSAFGDAAGGAVGIGADTGATFADSLTPATTGVLGGAIDAGTFGGAASGAIDTLASGQQVAQRFGTDPATGNFVDLSTLPSNATGIGADTGATFADSLTTATTGVAGGAVDAGTFGGDIGSGIASAAGTLGDLGGGAAAPIVAAPPPVTPFTQAAEGIPTLSGGGDIATGAGAPQATLASLGGGAGPGSTAGGTAAFAPPASLGGGGPGALDFTAATQGTPGSVFSGATDTASSIGPAAGSGIGADTGATFADSLTPATTGVEGGAVDAGVFSGSASDAPGLLSRIGGGISNVADKFGTSLEKAASDPLKLAGVALTGGSLLKDLAAPQQIPGIPQLTNLSNQTAGQGQNLINQGIGQGSVPAAGATNLAGSAVAQGQQLSSFLTNGNLPPGVQATIDQASNAAIQTIKGQYASRGMSGSSSELQDINAVKARAVSQGAQIAIQLTQQGLGFEQLGSQLYSSLIGQSNNLLQVGANLTGQSGNQLNGLIAANVAQNNQVNTAIGNLGRALAGGSVTSTNTNAAA